LATIKLLAPILPHVTERIYQGIFAHQGEADSIHRAKWPQVIAGWPDDPAVVVGENLVAIATAVRRYKSEQNLSLGAELSELQLVTADQKLAAALHGAQMDLKSITRAESIVVVDSTDPKLVNLGQALDVQIGLAV
jgi:valyl-tRNA synthetase